MNGFILKIKNRYSPSQQGEKGVVPPTTTAVFCQQKLGEWYNPVLVGSSTIGDKAINVACLDQVMQITGNLEPDDYLHYLNAYYENGRKRFGNAWRYADITTVLLATAELITPENYMEIGVRRGRSLAMVAATCPTAHVVGFDKWVENYAGMPNPGPEFVTAEMQKLGYRGTLELISGDSHETVPRYFREHPEMFFDLITVDGDHSAKGAEQDLRDVLPRLKLGGVLVFDDICHPELPHLAQVWQRVVASDRRFATWEYTELGYGVAFAIRRER
jgi:predicted O-methyltransferase YrrM